MNIVEQVENQIKVLTEHELRAFRDWFAEYDAEVWDRQIEADTKRGSLKALTDRAQQDFDAKGSPL